MHWFTCVLMLLWGAAFVGTVEPELVPETVSLIWLQATGIIAFFVARGGPSSPLPTTQNHYHDKFRGRRRFFKNRIVSSTLSCLTAS